MTVLDSLTHKRRMEVASIIAELKVNLHLLSEHRYDSAASNLQQCINLLQTCLSSLQAMAVKAANLEEL